MRIVHIASEFAPLAKVGGMADVLLGLARATVEAGHDVTVILPKYPHLTIPSEQIGTFSHTYAQKRVHNAIWRADYDAIPLLLLDPAVDFFRRPKIYGEEDDADRFAYFSSLVAAYLATQEPPDVIHVHDWHTALIPYLYKESRALLTLHNLAYPGNCTLSTLMKIGLSKESATPLKNKKSYSLLQGGILAADQITTVSPTYAEEILTPEFGGDFTELLQKEVDKLSGVLNGIDYTYWNPATDAHLPAHYSADSLEGKEVCKRQLQASFDLNVGDIPLISAVARLVPQKGPKLIEAALHESQRLGAQFLLLGSTSDPEIEGQFAALQKTYASNRNVHLELLYDEPLAHRTFAASDLTLVPSLFEPCGLTQMIALRYGTLPLVRATGGLADTIYPGKNGFTFLPPTEKAICETLQEALVCKREEPQKWEKLISNGMREDFSWKKPCARYLQLYQKESRLTPDRQA